MNVNDPKTGGPQVVLALYHPHAGKEAQLRALIARHLPTLRRLELITDRPAALVKSRNGTFIEMFEWRSNEAARQAHEHPEVATIWEAMGQCCDLTTLDSLEEAKVQFPHFEPVSL
jgi:hypothetical protein